MKKTKKQNLMKYNQKNIRIFAENNGRLYNLLKNGIPISQLKRMTPKQLDVKTGSASTYDRLRHLLCVVDDYIDERESYLAEIY